MSSYRIIEEALSSGSVDVNQRYERGTTRLIWAAKGGRSRIVQMLLARGADTAAVDDAGLTALHASALQGDLATARELVEAGAALDFVHKDLGSTALHTAADIGHIDVVEILVKAGAKLDLQANDEQTALYTAAMRGHCRVVKVLLRANANPSLESHGATPLDAAARFNRTQVVRELLERHAVDVCGGPTRGLMALAYAVQYHNIEIMAILSDGGVADTQGEVLCRAVRHGREESIKFLLQRARDAPASYALLTRGLEQYVNFARRGDGVSPMGCCLEASSLRPFSCRIVRMLLEAGMLVNNGFAECSGGSVASITALLRDKEAQAGYDATDDKVRGLRGIRRLLLQVDAVRAVS
ncbi:unnamed protein product [Ectocarpus sp. 8 AP-2014]